MNKVIHKLILDMKSVIVQQTIDIQRYDTGRKFEITLSDNGAVYQIGDGCIAVFTATKPDGTVLYNHCDVVDNTIVFDLLKNPQVAAAEGEVRCEIRLYGADGALITSPCFDIVVDKTVYTDNIIESSSEFTALTQAIVANINATKAANDAVEKAQLDIAEAVSNAESTVANAVSNAETTISSAVYNANAAVSQAVSDAEAEVDEAVADMRTVVDESANAIKGNVRGAVVSMADVSSIEHTAKVRVKSKNLIALPYHSPSQTTSGVTFTKNDDGSVTVNGTAEAKVIFYFQSYNTKLKLTKGESYVLSGCPGTGSSTTYMIQGTDGKTYYTDVGMGKQFVAKGEGFYFYIVVYEGFTANNLVFKPQLEQGETATEFTPWVDVSKVKLTRCGKNLLPYPFPETTLTRNGITYTDNGDGSVTIRGTATSLAYFYVARNIALGDVPINSISVPNATNGKYTISKRLYYGVDNTLSLQVLAGETVDETLYPQLELGAVATDYEPYKETKEYTPNSDGTVDGVKSLSPCMTLFTDTDGVEIVCEYNRDSNKVLEELLMLMSQGGLSTSAARIVDVSIYANKWVGTKSPYSQVVSVDGATEYSQVDLTPSVEQLSVFHNKDLAFVTENVDGVVTVYAIGQKPENDYTIQATVKEVMI